MNDVDARPKSGSFLNISAAGEVPLSLTLLNEVRFIGSGRGAVVHETGAVVIEFLALFEVTPPDP